MSFNDIQRAAFDAVARNISEDGRVNLVLQLAEELGVASKVVPVERAETIARGIAEDLNRTKEVRHGDRVITDKGEAIAVVLTPEEVLRRLS